MGRVWDIVPPRRHPQKQTSKRVKKSKNASLFFGFLILIFVIFFIYAASQNKSPVTESVKTISTPQESPKDKTLIKILNGTGKGEETTKVSQIVEDLGLKVNKTENALNLYDQTIVYYNPSQEENAQRIATALETYQAKIQAFSQQSPYDLVVVIGGR